MRLWIAASWKGDPHRMLEGMMIAGIAVGASEGYIYVRAEYPLAVSRLQTAIQQAEEYGLLGDDILGSGNELYHTDQSRRRRIRLR